MIIIDSILDIVDDYENYIIDQWGVMHDGSSGFKHAIDTINLLEKKNKNLFIVSNSSKRKQERMNGLSVAQCLASARAP